MKSLKDLNVANKRVLLRAGFDVPLRDGFIRDDSRIREVLPTIKYLVHHKAKVIILSHNGRPSGSDVSLSLEVVANRLAKLLGMGVGFVSDCVGPVAETAVSKLKAGEILVLENLRFHEGEEANDPVFVSQLAKLGDVFVNDSFPVCHRAHASIVGLPKMLPSAPGITLLKELHAFSKLDHPVKPYCVIIGGAKTDKLKMVAKLAEKADMVLLGGMLANTFLAARGLNIGSSKFDPLGVPLAKEILAKFSDKILVPEDAVLADDFSENANTRVASVRNVSPNELILDIGHHTIESYARAIEASSTIAWGGPIGFFEWAKFRNGTSAVAHAVAHSKAFSVIGGGDSGDAIHALKLEDKVSHVSTGGGASLKLLAGEKLVGVEALR